MSSDVATAGNPEANGDVSLSGRRRAVAAADANGVVAAAAAAAAGLPDLTEIYFKKWWVGLGRLNMFRQV